MRRKKKLPERKKRKRERERERKREREREREETRVEPPQCLPVTWAHNLEVQVHSVNTWLPWTKSISPSLFLSLSFSLTYSSKRFRPTHTHLPFFTWHGVRAFYFLPLLCCMSTFDCTHCSVLFYSLSLSLSPLSLGLTLGVPFDKTH